VLTEDGHILPNPAAFWKGNPLPLDPKKRSWKAFVQGGKASPQICQGMLLVEFWPKESRQPFPGYFTTLQAQVGEQGQRFAHFEPHWLAIQLDQGIAKPVDAEGAAHDHVVLPFGPVDTPIVAKSSQEHGLISIASG
jgi:hypothetical protein